MDRGAVGKSWQLRSYVVAATFRESKATPIAAKPKMSRLQIATKIAAACLATNHKNEEIGIIVRACLVPVHDT